MGGVDMECVIAATEALLTSVNARTLHCMQRMLSSEPNSLSTLIKLSHEISHRVCNDCRLPCMVWTTPWRPLQYHQ